MADADFDQWQHQGLQRQIDFIREEYKAEMASIRVIAEKNSAELAVSQAILQRFDKALFGNGQPGVIEIFQKKLSLHDKWIWIATGVIVAWQFLAGNGVLSLKALIGK